MKKILAIILAAAMLTGFAACGEKKPAETTAAEVTPDVDANTLGGKMVLKFDELMKGGTDLLAAMEEIAALTDMSCVTMEIEAGTEYLNGFNDKVDGYTKGVTFGPMIGSIPMVGYIFESEDPEALLDQLTSKADPRWNICTEAEETISYISGNMVFFAMLPGDEG